MVLITCSSNLAVGRPTDRAIDSPIDPSMVHETLDVLDVEECDMGCNAKQRWKLFEVRRCDSCEMEDAKSSEGWKMQIVGWWKME
jgi:hypothetical protein